MSTTDSSVMIARTPVPDVAPQKSVLFNGRVQMKCIDRKFIRPFVERLMFPEKRPVNHDTESLTQFIENHRKRLERSVKKSPTLSDNLYIKLCQIRKFDICKNRVSFEGRIVDYRSFPGFQRKQYQCELTYIPKDYIISISTVAEQDGFDVLIYATYMDPYIKVECKPQSEYSVLLTNCFCQTSFWQNAQRMDFVVCVLIIENMMDHLAVLRQINANLKHNAKKWNRMEIRVVLIVGTHSNDFTTKELTEYFDSQKVIMIMSDDFM